MKTLGFIMGNKLLTAVIVILIVGMLYLYATGTSVDDIIGGASVDDETPDAALTIVLTDTSTGTSGTHTMDISELSPTASLFGTPQVLTSYQQDVWGIVPDNSYTISFTVSATALMPVGSPSDTTLMGTIYMTGTTPNPTEIPSNPGLIYDNYMDSSDKLNTSIENPTTWNTTTQYEVPDFIYLGEQSGAQDVILGENIHGSTFHITFIVKDVATNGMTYYGVITADIVLNVDNDGNVEVTIDNVDAGVN